MTAKHTPGPWHVSQLWAGYTGAEIRAGDTKLAILLINGHNAEHGEANARLIAAAPDLLAVLQTVRELADARTNLPVQCPTLWIEICEVIDKALGK